MTVRADWNLRIALATRWRDNDVYGHINNCVYNEYFDTAVNLWIARSGALTVPGGPVVGLVAETRVRFLAALRHPAALEAGLAVARIGRSSVLYDLALFAEDDAPAALCRYVHVYVDAETHRPTPLPDAFRAALEAAPKGVDRWETG